MYKVLLIDDEESMHISISKMLEEGGYAYVGARDGESGMKILDSEKPDCLLLDVMLPGINGFDLCRRIREKGKRIPILFISAKTDIVDKSIGFKAGCDDYITKPSTPPSCCCALKPTSAVTRTPSITPSAPPGMASRESATWRSTTMSTRPM